MSPVMLLALVATCSSCDTTIDWVVDGEADYGTVYLCDSDAMCLSESGGPATEEWCWDGPKDELEALLGAECRRITVFDRAFPAIVGCAYCCGADCGRGANAHCGSFCEVPL